MLDVIFLLQRFFFTLSPERQTVDKELNVNILKRLRDVTRRKRPKYGQKTIAPQQCPIIRNYLAKSSVTT